MDVSIRNFKVEEALKNYEEAIKSDIDNYIKIDPKESLENRKIIPNRIKLELGRKYNKRFYFTIHSDPNSLSGSVRAYT